MNKKVLTLCAGFLLAGGLTSQAFAESFQGITSQIAAGTFNEDQYYYVNLDNRANQTSIAISNNQLDINATGLWSQEENRSTWWRIQPVQTTDVNGDKFLIGFKLISALTGEPLTITDGGTTYDTFLKSSSTHLAFAKADGTSANKYFKGSLTEVGTSIADGQSYSYSLQAVPVEELTKDEINKVNNDYFGLQFGYINNDGDYVNYEDLQGVDPFVGKLVAKNTPFGGENNAGVSIEITPEGWTATNPGENYFIYNETADAYVVLLKEKWSINNTNHNPATPGNGHKFALMTAKQIIEDQTQANDKDKKIATYSFKVNMPVVVDYSPLEVVAVSAWMDEDKSQTNSADLEMYIANMGGINYLTTTKAEDNTITPANEALVAVDPTYTNVRFGMTDYINMSQFYGWAITIKGLEGEGVEGMTVRPDADNDTNIDASVWTKADYVAFSRPEAHWIVTVDNTGVLKLTNRETKKSLRWDEAFDMLGNVNNGNSLALRQESENIYVNGDYKFEIKKVEELGKDSWDDYGRYIQDESEIGTTRTYKVTFGDAFGTTSYIGMDGKGNVELTRDEAAAINFDIVRTQTTDTLNNDGTVAENAQVDYFQIYNNIMAKNKDGEWEFKANGDTLSFYRYKLAYGDKFLTYNDAKKQFELIEEDVVYTDASKDDDDKVVDYGKSTLADNFIVKLKENDKVNVVKVLNYEMEDINAGKYYDSNSTNTNKLDNIYRIDATDTEKQNGTADMFTKNDDWANYREGEEVLANGKMMFFDFNNKEVQEQQNIYAWNANAQLTIAPQSFNSYRYFATPDTMEFYRVEYADEFLYEKTTKVGEDVINFLGMTYNRDMYNPAIYVDTAYIQDTKKPTYLLAVDADIEPSHQYCPIHGIDPTDCPADHQTTIPGYVTARYLVSFTDSVDAHAAELKNPYLEDGKYTKLGFVDAVHGVNDLNIIQNGDTVKTYELTNAAAKTVLNPVEFAFRIVNQSTQDFIIESVNKGEVSYIRWQNGVPVLTTDITDAEVFNVRETSAIPTANEEISAEAGAVSVVATDGAIIVKGAEGKNVVVATILGKVVANEVATSDNETIAVPAGIAVVAVDGESFKVVVK